MSWRASEVFGIFRPKSVRCAFLLRPPQALNCKTPLFAPPAANDSHKDAFVDKVREYRGKRMLSVEMLADLVNRMPAHAGSTLEEYKRSQILFNRMPFEELVGTERKERILAPLP